MARKAGIWQRGNRGWYTNYQGKQIKLGDSFQQAEKEFYRLKAKGGTAEVGGATVINLAHCFLEAMSSTVKPKTHRGYRFAMQSFVNQHGRKIAATLRPLHVTEWLDANPQWNVSSRHSMATIVKAWSSWCTRWGHLEVDRLKPARYPQGEPRKPADADELDMLLVAAKKHSRELGDILEVLMETGARPGEIRHLEAKDIAWTQRTAKVRGKTGERVIGLTVKACKTLRRYASMHPEGPVMRTRTGNRWLQPTLKRQVDKAVTEAGVSHIVPYQARHAFWEPAIKAGVDSVAIGRQLGHKNLSMLMKHYAHASAETLVSVVDKAAGAKRKSRAGQAAKGKAPGKARATPRPRTS